MIAMTLTPDAQFDLDRYLRQVRAALRSHPAVDADDVERDVRSHIESELQEAARPVTASELRAVLERLGSPGQWVPVDELPLWRRIAMQLQSGPEDWRLTYLTFACFIVGPLLGPIGPLFFFGSFFLARATLALLEERDEPAGARRWLIYPPLIVVYLALSVSLLVVPLLVLLPMAGEPSVRPALEARLGDPFWPRLGAMAAVVAGLWWVAVGVGVAWFRQAVRAVFHPFAERFERRHAGGLVLAGLVVALLAGGALFALT